MSRLPRLTLCLAILVLPLGAITAQAVPAAAPTIPPKLVEAQRLIAQQQYREALPLLRDVLQAQPLYGPAWMSLGSAFRSLQMPDSAGFAYEQASKRPAMARQALLQLVLLYADVNQNDNAFRWFEQLQRNAPDFTSVRNNREIDKLKNDARFATLFPSTAEMAKPFVENVRIIHEWRGELAGDEFGWIAREIGDVDKDGVTDVATSATANPPGGSRKGKVYAYSGKSGKLLWKQEGAVGAFFGNTLEAAGDVNKDGIPDVVVGAPGINGFFVYSGLDGRELRKIVGDSTTVDLGRGVAGVGDLNKDGYADLLASAPSATSKGASTGLVRVFSGKDSRPLLSIEGEAAGDSFGSTLGTGNGRHFAVGASGAGPRGAGRIYAFDGLNTKPLFTRDADSTGAALGAMFASVLGDVDGDGTPDIYATDFSNSAGGPGAGRAYVYSGRTGQSLFVKSGSTAGEGMGIGAGRTGDINGDGHADFIVAGWQFAGAAWSGGRVQVFSGKDGSVLQTFTGRVPGETLGFDAVGVGDIDGDGTTDFLLTSAWSVINGVRSGRMYIVAGTTENPKAKKRATSSLPKK